MKFSLYNEVFMIEWRIHYKLSFLLYNEVFII